MLYNKLSYSYKLLKYWFITRSKERKLNHGKYKKSNNYINLSTRMSMTNKYWTNLNAFEHTEVCMKIWIFLSCLEKNQLFRSIGFCGSYHHYNIGHLLSLPSYRLCNFAERWKTWKEYLSFNISHEGRLWITYFLP